MKITLEEKEKLNSVMPEYLNSINLKETSNQLCPICGGHGFSYNKKNNTITCFSAGHPKPAGCEDYKNIDLIGLIEDIEHIDFIESCKYIDNHFFNGSILSGSTSEEHIKPKEIIKEHEETAPEQIKKINKYIEDCQMRLISDERETGRNYFKNRGFTDKNILKYKLGQDTITVNNIAYDVVIIPYPNENYYIKRFIDKIPPNWGKYIKPSAKETGNIKEPIFCCDSLERHQEIESPIFIVEGQIDSLILNQMGYNSMAIGTGYKEEILNYIKENQKIILALDNDIDKHKGQANNLKYQTELNKRNINNTILNLVNKDINEDFINCENELKNNIDAAIKEVNINKNVTTYFMDQYFNPFLHEHDEETKPTPTGFKMLDNSLGGGLFSGLTFIGASPSVGKTTFILQLVESIAMNEQKNILYFSLEMSQRQLLSKSLSRLTYQTSKKDTFISLSSTELLKKYEWNTYPQNKIDAIKKSLEIYKTYGDNIRIVEASNPYIEDIIEIINSHSKRTGETPIIVIDYLQLLSVKDNKTGSEDQATIIKRALIKLKEYAIKNNAIVICITAFNRASNGIKTGLDSGRDTSNIEYSADYYFSLNFTEIEAPTQGLGLTKDEVKDLDIEDLKNADIRNITLKVLKNRMGSTGNRVFYTYIPKFNYFEEYNDTTKSTKKTINKKPI